MRIIYVMRSGQIALHGLSKDLTDKELERAYFGFDDGGAPRNGPLLKPSCAEAGNGPQPLMRSADR